MPRSENDKRIDYVELVVADVERSKAFYGDAFGWTVRDYGPDYCEFDDGRLKTASYDASEGFGLRAVRGEVTGYAHATEISEAALKRAAETARLAVGDGGGVRDGGGHGPDHEPADGRRKGPPWSVEPL